MAEPDFYLSDEQRELQRTLREFVTKEIAPIAAASDAEERYPLELFPKLGELGYLGLRFPEEVGGSGGSNLDYTILCEELAYGSAGIALGIYVHMALACAALEAFGGETLRQTWLAPALRGEKIGAWAFAEAGAGSDAGSVATRAVADGDGYVLDGSKLFITNGPVADFLIVVASTAPEQRLKGLSLFLVERDRPGFRVAASLSKLGVRASEMAELVFESPAPPSNPRWPTRGSASSSGSRSARSRPCASASRTWPCRSRPRDCSATAPPSPPTGASRTAARPTWRSSTPRRPAPGSSSARSTTTVPRASCPSRRSSASTATARSSSWARARASFSAT
jgi:hypothetical protein